MAGSDPYREECSDCGVTNGPQHVFCRNCGTYLSISRIHEEVQERNKRVWSDVIYRKKEAMTVKLNTLITITANSSLALVIIGFFFLMVGDPGVFLISFSFSIVVIIFVFGLFTYADWARNGLVLSYTFLSFLYFMVGNFILGVLAIILTVSTFETLYLDKKTVDLFELDWNYEWS